LTDFSSRDSLPGAEIGEKIRKKSAKPLFFLRDPACEEEKNALY